MHWRIKQLRSGLLAVLGFTLIAAVGEAQAPARDTAALRREIEALNRDMGAAFVRGDTKATAAYFADHAVMRSAHAVNAQGRQAIDAYFGAVPNPKRWAVDVYGVSDGGGNLVYQTGRTTLAFGAPERTATYDNTIVWQRQPDGRLRIIMFYYHSPEPPSVSDGDSTALRRELEQLNREMEAAFNRGDMAAAAAFYADDGIVRSDRGVDAGGRAGIDRYFGGITNPRSWKLEVLDVHGTSQMAYQVGRSTLVHGSPERDSVVHFMVVWRRQPDGRLKIVMDYHHSPTSDTR